MTVRHHVRLARLACSALLVGVAACGGSSSPTGPTTPTPAQLAAYFDSIYSARLAKGTTADSTIAGRVRDLLEFPPAFGAVRSTLTLSTTGGAQTWYGFTYGSLGADTEFVTVAYSDTSLSNVLLIYDEYDNSGQTIYTPIYTRFLTDPSDSNTIGAYTGTTSATAGSFGPACTMVPGLAAASTFQSFDLSTCLSATFTVTLNATYVAATLGPLATISFSNAGFTGPLSGATDAGQHVSAGPTRESAWLARVRALVPRAVRSRG